MGGVFVSYRRQDSQGSTGRLADRLGQLVGDDIPVFVDIDSIRPGQDFRRVIADTLAKCDVTLVIIGPRWLSATDDKGRRRLDDPTDLHRLEVESALASTATTIPVLVEGAAMPSADELPDSIEQLAYLHAAEVLVRRFAADADYLAEMITTEVARVSSLEPPPAPPTPEPSAIAESVAEPEPVSPEPVAVPVVEADTPAHEAATDPVEPAAKDRRPLLLAAALGAIVLGIVVLVAVLSDGDDDSAGSLGDDKAGLTAPELAENTADASASVFSLEVGQCFNADPTSTGDMMVVDCSELHFHEVFAVYPSFSGTPPGAEILVDGCNSRFRDAVGVDYANSVYYFSAIWPDDASWDAGQRDVVCFGYTQDAEARSVSSGSMLGSNR